MAGSAEEGCAVFPLCADDGGAPAGEGAGGVGNEGACQRDGCGGAAVCGVHHASGCCGGADRGGALRDEDLGGVEGVRGPELVRQRGGDPILFYQELFYFLGCDSDIRAHEISL